MSANLEVSRSIQFVSLDTHPANNALVVTYEILASVHTVVGQQRELERRNKRHQFQVHISALDGTRAEEEVGLLDLASLADQIVQKCPLLEPCHAEEIQLHLLYLVGRRRAQLEGARHQVGSHPASAVSMSRFRANDRVRSAQSILGRRSNSAASQPRGTGSGRQEAEMAIMSIYARLKAREEQRQVEESSLFLEQLDARLRWREERDEPIRAAIARWTMAPATAMSEQAAKGLEEQLEGLYGERHERLAAMGVLRRLSREDGWLPNLANNKLLVAALLRSLRQPVESSDHQDLCESILFCLIRFTWFDDLYLEMFCDAAATTSEPSNQKRLELIRIVVGLLGKQVDYQLSARSKSGDPEEDHRSWYFQTRATLLCLSNLLRCDTDAFCLHLAESLAQDREQGLVGQLARLLMLAGQMLREESKSDLSGLMVDASRLMGQLCAFRELVGQLRTNQPPPTVDFLEWLVEFLASLQSRRQQQTSAVEDLRQVELYELELELLRLANQLALDRRLRLRLLKRHLLKCHLKSLAMFLASTNSSDYQLHHYQRSSVLLVPLRGLYELSCEPVARQELFRSKLAMKCLLEYLLLSAAFVNLEKFAKSDDSLRVVSEQQQIVGEPASLKADEWVVCLWANLSACQEAPIYRDDHLAAMVRRYIDLSLSHQLVQLLEASPSSLKIYLHAKLLRNLTQFMGSPSIEPQEEQRNRWLEAATGAAESITTLAHDDAGRQHLKTALLAEFVGLLGNLLASSPVGLKPALSARCSLLIGALLKAGGQLEGSLSLRESEQDDLLLVAVMLVGRLAQRAEVCDLELMKDEQTLGALLSASRSLLEWRQLDDELLVAGLYALAQLMRHARFLRHLQLSLEEDGNEQQGATWDLVARLGRLLQHPRAPLARLAALLLARLRQLEETSAVGELPEAPSVHRSRFGAYNDKWLTAMRSSNPNPASGLPPETEMSNGGGDQWEELNELRACTAASLHSNENSNSSAGQAELDDDDDGEVEEDFLSDQEEGQEEDAADLADVIDARSMTRHLGQLRH